MQSIDPQELKEWLDDSSRAKPLLLDVREAWEFDLGHIEGARSLPMQQVPRRLNELTPDEEIVVVCHHGVRSAQVAQFLMRNGLGKVRNLQGGIHAWAEQVDPAMPKY